jgi:hypothetical protein
MAALAFDGSQPTRPVGHYTYSVPDAAWTWSDGVYLLHGFAPHEVPATTGVLLRHKHPDDRSRTFEVMEAAIADGEPFSCYHRIIDRQERVRNVLSVGRGIKDAEGRVERVDGYFVDLTEVRRTETQAEVETALARIAEHREVIDEAKGMLMLAAGCDADTAFDLLRRSSQHANVRVHAIAHRLVGAAARLGSPETRVAVSRFLADLGPHQNRVPGSSANSRTGREVTRQP